MDELLPPPDVEPPDDEPPPDDVPPPEPLDPLEPLDPDDPLDPLDPLEPLPVELLLDAPPLLSLDELVLELPDPESLLDLPSGFVDE